ncbi:thioesterase superfamily protein [Gordonia bronchialis DSM 43247]|uniref:Thioesterase superfamily protein n=1 Tax=Gordonia bronchialis (strain ATCC 25592 / DSM 43247 / BCRC 13721 / JCM 3198 / KCTC 3076 / NBRC 16047 / NCTC 10667) TaxID=526226 RepID=D0L8Y6_GORB4|nr:PaaI family thioesterase [Gordonia bronchialis]ACY21977.1 thioesterase superfamily protein [Gordonia bronchialis DSM 43247]MCC3324767.1 PaaI family thioesterase [Gordonia bronchialis]QGS24444.1 hotdog fold thioesterase [Gordonia bronchialis]UAK39261.1 PaaI family thioesterase [Gordonia bronchialis]STQ64887.1 Putative esterase Rv1847/MT1895 [Gordonia bronchialis]
MTGNTGTTGSTGTTGNAGKTGNAGTDSTERDVRASLGRGLDSVLGLTPIEVGADGLVASLEIADKHHQPFGIVHGGVYCAVAESVASMSGYFWLQESGIGGTAVGVNNNTDFLRSIRSGTVTARSTPIHRGRRQQLWAVEMTDDDGRLLARSQVRLQNIELPDGQAAPA